MERVVRGAHPVTAEETDLATRALVPALARLHHRDRWYVPVTSVLSPHSVHRLDEWATTSQGSPVGALATSLAAAAEVVLAGHGRSMVSRGWSHGDLVPSNIVLRCGVVTLLDWEFVGHRALGFDLVRLLAPLADPDEHLDTFVAESSGAGQPDDVLPVDAQVAVAGLRSACGYAQAERAAARSGRGEQARTAVARRAGFIDHLVARSGIGAG